MVTFFLKNLKFPPSGNCYHFSIFQDGISDILDDVTNRFKFGDWRLLHILAYNMSPLVLGEFILELNNQMREKEELEVIFGEEETASECELCPVTVQQRLTLNPQSGHSGLVVSCHHQTSGHSGLHVTVITPTQADLERLTHSQGLGLVPGILISSILVLLSLAVLISFCIRGSRNRKQKQSHTESEDPELGKSFVENENIVKGGGGVTDVIEKVYDEDANKDASFTDSSIHSSEHSDTNTSDSVSPSDGDKDKQERA